MRSHLREACVDEKVQTTTKDLVSYEDGNVEITNGHCTAILPGIMPAAGSCESEHNNVGDKNDSEKFPVMWTGVLDLWPQTSLDVCLPIRVEP